MPALDSLFEIVGKWRGRWDDGKGKGDELSCVTTRLGENSWEALFTARCGETYAYTVKLAGHPSENGVHFGGQVDLGAGHGFLVWTGEVGRNGAAIEFNGTYEGSDSGTFKMRRVPDALGENSAE